MSHHDNGHDPFTLSNLLAHACNANPVLCKYLCDLGKHAGFIDSGKTNIIACVEIPLLFYSLNLIVIDYAGHFQ